MMIHPEISQYICNIELRKILLSYEIEQPIQIGKMMKNVAFGKNYNELKIKASDNSFFLLKRSQPFSNIEKEVVNSFFLTAESYKKVEISLQKYLLSTSLSRIISSALGQNLHEFSREMISNIIETLEQWSSQTYEGNRISCSIVIDLSIEKKTDVYFREYIEEDFSRVISNGVDTVVIFDQQGFFVDYKYLEENSDELLHVPLSYSKIAFYTKDHEDRIAFILNRNGEILIIKNSNLVFSKRRGKWQIYNHDALISKMTFGSKKIPEQLRKEIYASCLDASFSRHGGCIGILMRTKQKSFISSRVAQSDILANQFMIGHKDPQNEEGKITNTKRKIISSAIDEKLFQNISRKLRQEMIGIDGATIIDSLGTLIAVGAILKIDPGSKSGGRRAAAECISKSGLGLKISADGEIIMIGEKNLLSIG